MKKNNYIYYIVTAFLFFILLIPDVLAEGCPLGPNVTKDLYGVLKIMQIIAPIICIGFSVWEAIKAVTRGKADEEMKIVAKRFGKRMIYAVLLFFLPVLVDQVMQIANVWGVDGTCDLSNPVDNSSSGFPTGECKTLGQNSCSVRVDCKWQCNASGYNCGCTLKDSCNILSMQGCSERSDCEWVGDYSGSCKTK